MKYFISFIFYSVIASTVLTSSVLWGEVTFDRLYRVNLYLEESQRTIKLDPLKIEALPKSDESFTFLNIELSQDFYHVLPSLLNKWSSFPGAKWCSIQCESLRTLKVLKREIIAQNMDDGDDKDQSELMKKLLNQCQFVVDLDQAMKGEHLFFQDAQMKLVIGNKTYQKTEMIEFLKK